MSETQKMAVTTLVSLLFFHSIYIEAICLDSTCGVLSPSPTPSPDLQPPKKSLALAPFVDSPSQAPSPSSMPEESPVSPNDPPVDPAIKKICDATDYSLLCLSSTTPFFDGDIDPISVLHMQVHAAQEATKLALAMASSLAVSQDQDSFTVSALGDCKELYDDAVDNFQEALNAIPSRDISTMNTMLSAALTDYITCDDGFRTDSLLDVYNDKLRKMASNCLAIASLIQ